MRISNSHLIPSIGLNLLTIKDSSQGPCIDKNFDSKELGWIKQPLWHNKSLSNHKMTISKNCLNVRKIYK